jgi:mannitol/fructose-specific phosphotransferase system IIA component
LIDEVEFLRPGGMDSQTMAELYGAHSVLQRLWRSGLAYTLFHWPADIINIVCTLAGMSTQDAQTMQSIANAFKKHESDLKSGDLSAAKQDYVMLK